MLLERISVALALRLQNVRYTTNSCRFWQNEAKMINLFNGPPLMGQAEMRRPFTKKCMEPFWPDEPNLNTLVERRLGPAQAFDRRFFDSSRRSRAAALDFGRPARTRRHRGAANQVEQAFARILAIALLGAMASCVDHQHALAREALAGKPLEPRTYQRFFYRCRLASHKRP
jgi:hypothetical protein